MYAEQRRIIFLIKIHMPVACRRCNADNIADLCQTAAFSMPKLAKYSKHADFGLH